MPAIMGGLGGPGKSNADIRRPLILTDQHGRQWWTNRDTRTDEPVGGIHADGWTAPWMPPQQYLVRQGDQIVIQYDQWLADQRDAHEEYQRRLLELSRANHQPINRDATTGVPQFSPLVLHEAGVPPLPLEPIVAMQQGNRFALGLSSEVDARLAAFLPQPVQRMAALKDLDFSEPAEPAPSPKPAPVKGRKE